MAMMTMMMTMMMMMMTTTMTMTTMTMMMMMIGTSGGVVVVHAMMIRKSGELENEERERQLCNSVLDESYPFFSLISLEWVLEMASCECGEASTII